jgi:hypothetical protein
MSEYRFLCPKCGHGFAEGTSFKKCPRCQVRLLEAAPNWAADLRNLPGAVDLDALLREVLADQRPGEDIDQALARYIVLKYPDSQQGMIHLIGAQINEWQKARSVSRQAAAEELARAQSELTVGSEGQSEVRTEFRSEMRIDGLEQLSPELRDEALKQIEQMMRTGATDNRVLIGTKIGNRRIGCGTVILVAVMAAVGGWAVLD